MMKWLRRGVLLLALVAVVVAIALGVRKKPIAVETTKIERGPFLETIDEPGKTRVRERFVVSAPVSGELVRIVRKPGDAVNAGDVIATIRPVAPSMQDIRTRAELEARLRSAETAQTLASTGVDRAKALLDFANRELARIKGLVEKGTLPGRDLEKAELDRLLAQKDLRNAELSARVSTFDLEVAKAAVGIAEGKPESPWSVKAPLAGRILRVSQASEAVVAAGTPLVEIADPHDLEVVASLLTADAVRVQPGARTLLDRWGGGETLEGRVRTVEPAGYTKVSALGVEEQRVDVVIDLVSPPEKWAALGDGFRVQTHTIVFRSEDAIKASSAALFRDGDRWALFVVDEGRAHKRHVAVERRSGLEAMVRGIEPGTTVVAFPSTDLEDGSKIVLR